MKKLLLVIISMGFAFGAQAQWQSLFNGKNFKGWEKAGGDVAREMGRVPDPGDGHQGNEGK